MLRDGEKELALETDIGLPITGSLPPKLVTTEAGLGQSWELNT